MRRLLLGAIGGAVTLAACAALAAPRFADLPGKASPGAIGVDVELVLAVDISYSMDFDELKLQREGYIEALTSKEFLNALKQGMHGKVAVTLVRMGGRRRAAHRDSVALDRRTGERAKSRGRACGAASAARIPDVDLRGASVFRAAVREQRILGHPPRDRRLG